MSNLRVWHVPQVPGKPFQWLVATPQEASNVLWILEAYDAFQYRENIKPDYTSAGGLEEFDEGDGNWYEWFDDDDDDISKYDRYFQKGEE